MAVFLSYQHAINVARKSYEQFGFTVSDLTPGQKIEAELKQDIKHSEMGCLFAILDEFIFIYRYFGHYYISSMFGNNKEVAVNQARLNELMLSTLISIRVLSAHGLDVNARNQVRFLYELSLLWSRLNIDPIALAEFGQSGTPDKVNKFWHKYTSKGKTEKFLADPNNYSGMRWIGAADAHLTGIYKTLGMTNHPGFLGGYFDLMHNWNSAKSEEENLASRGASGASQFVLTSTIFLAMLPFGFDPLPKFGFVPIEMFKPSEIYPPHSESENWSDYCEKLRKVLILLVAMMTRFSEGLSKARKVTPDDPTNSAEGDR